MSVIWSIQLNNTINKTKMQDKIMQLNRIYGDIRIQTGQPTVDLQVIDDPQVNAWTDGKMITFTTGILEFFNGDEDQIALVLSHEAAHVMLGHTDETNTLFTIAQKEGQADKMGAYIMLRSGYNICNGYRFFDKLAKMRDGDFADPGIYQSPHPSYAYRKYSLQMPWCPN